MAVIEISNIKQYTAESSTELPATALEGSLAYVATTGTPVTFRRWRMIAGVWAREAVDATT